MKIKSLYYLAVVFLILGLIIAAVPTDKSTPYKISSDEVLKEIVNGDFYMLTDEVAEMLVKETPNLQLIDVRSPEEFNRFHIDGAINIPLSELLSNEWKDYLDQDTYMNVFYCRTTTRATQAWMLTRQLGYDNLYVLKGGLKKWVSTILNPQSPEASATNYDFLNFQLRKAAGQFILGGNQAISGSDDTKKVKPKRPRRITGKKKKIVEGGCS